MKPGAFDLADIKRRMQGALNTLKQELGGLRTGRASANLVEPIHVEAYGSNMPMNQVASVSVPEPRLISIQVWDASVVKAVEKANSFEPDKVIDAMIGVAVPNLTGGLSTMMPNHHITKPVYIGEIQANGLINTVWQTPGTVVAQEWSPYLEGSRDLISDWRHPLECGNVNVKTGKCGG